ncbi:3-carboxy-cis,cis-muconate cycloisomerase [Nonomuraea rhodomycinica]|uniref:3-carboxy-cis,cis-muconate cycloisomerase n=2 Tax=Nonomuraea rhodomycinica TaxID=1712872 RepID=A0A7Y6IQF8_9ACTN|nr:3-carboxy-cis,cis-muconate cycloisomerase [Nonomuraea rhodomycinica]
MRVAAAEETGDAAVLRAMLDAEAALARAQASLGLIPARAAEAVTAAARDGAFDPLSLAERARWGGNPVIPLVEDLRAAAAPYGVFVHRGATSQDILDTALMLVAHRALGPVTDHLELVAGRLGGLAAEHRDTVMAARTLTQQAVPTTFGLKAAGWRELAAGARTRLLAARQALPAQLGGPAGTLRPTDARADSGGADGDRAGGDRADGDGADGDVGLRLLAAFAAETGLAEPVLPWHVLRAPVADLAGALAFAAGALGKLAADVLVLSRTEIAEVREGAGGGSSSMPHKRNPVRATMIAAAARQVPALAAILYGSLAAEDERPPGAWHAEWQPLREALRLVAGAARDAAELVAGLRVDPGRMRANLDVEGTPGSAAALVTRALSPRTAPGRSRAGGGPGGAEAAGHGTGDA